MARKRRRRERQRDGRTPESTPAPVRASTPSAAEQDWRLPSPFARIAGGALAVVTFVIAGVVVVSGFSDELAPIDVGLRLLAGLVLVGVGVVLLALSVAPGFVRSLFVRM